MKLRKRSLVVGTMVVLALVLILLAAIVTDGALDWFEIAIALVLMVVSFWLQRHARREIIYSRLEDDDQSGAST